MADCVQRGVGGVPAGIPSSTGSSFLNGTRVYPDGVVWDGPLIQRVATLSVIMLFTLAGNSTILVVLSRPRVAKRASRVNLFIFNLALGDLAVCLFTQSSEMLFEVGACWRHHCVASHASDIGPGSIFRACICRTPNAFHE